MFNSLSAVEKFAAAAASCVIAAVALLAALKLTIAPAYTDFIVGYITWVSDSKLQDIIAAPAFVAALVLSCLFISLQLARQKQQFGETYSASLSNQLIWWALPSFVGISSLVLGSTVDKSLLLVSASGIGFVTIVSFYNAKKNICISPEVVGMSVLAVFLISLLPLEIALVIGRVPMTLINDIDPASCAKAKNIISGFGVLVGLFCAMHYPAQVSRYLPSLLLLGQIGLPTLFLTLYPAALVQPDGGLTKYETTVWLKLLLAGAVLWGLYDVIRRYRAYHASANDWAECLSPVALVGLLVALQVGSTVVPQISPDDYHFGESLLGWWSLSHGAVPYVDYMPAHGLIDDYLAQCLSYIFYDGSAGSVMEAGRLSFAVMAFAAFMSMYLFSGSIGLAFVSIFFLGGSLLGKLSYVFLTSFLCLWSSRPLRITPARWLSVWILTAPVAILGVPPQGLLLVAASGAMAAYCSWQLWSNPQERAWRCIGSSLIALVALGLATPLFPMLFGAIRYVVENGPINQVAYGVPWALSWRAGAKAGFVFEAIRMSWIAAPIACLSIIYIKGRDQHYRHFVLPAVVVLLFALLLIPYSMGRIDPGGVSRPGLSAIFGWAVLLPVAAWGLVKPNNRCSFILLVACMSAALDLTSLSFSGLVSAVSPSVRMGPFRDGRSAGLSNIGKAYVQDDQWDRLARLSAVLNSTLAPGESYLDLTSRNAQYFYLNRRPVVAVTAPYNMVAPSQQKRVVEQLLRGAPRVALLEGSNITFDGGGLALRNPYLYRFVLDNYTPKLEDGFIVGYKNGEANTEVPSGFVVKNLTDANWDRGVHRSEPAVIVGDAALTPFLESGMKIHIGAGEVRTITRVWTEGNAIWFDGALIDPSVAGYPHRVGTPFNPEFGDAYRASLFDKAFALSDFKEIPVSWGRSAKSLDNKMKLIHGLDALSPALHELTAEGGAYRVSGARPKLSFDTSRLALSGRDAGLLKFEFSCIKKDVKAMVQVSWLGGRGGSDVSSIKFTAYNGPLIVPLDASPRWLMMKDIKEIRIHFDNASACGSFRVQNLGLYQRNL